MPPLSWAAVEIDYTIRRSTRARRVRVAVDAHDGVQVTLPARAREREAALAVAELRPWIERRLAEVRAARERLAVPAGHLPYLGAHLALAPEAGRLRAHRRGDALLVPADEPRAAIERWYRRTARAEIAPRLDEAVAALGRAYTKLTIREQRTRWGSCSTTGAMSFNWRLLLGPEEVLDYVVWHEACHLVVMDHSRALLVAARAPPPRLPRAAALAAGQRQRARAARLSDGPPLRACARRHRCDRGGLRRGREGPRPPDHGGHAAGLEHAGRRSGDQGRRPAAPGSAPRGVDPAHAGAVRRDERARPAPGRLRRRPAAPLSGALPAARGRLGLPLVDAVGDAEAITAHAPMIVVMPDGGADGWYTDWYQGDRPVQPRWETYHVGELIPWIDATYRTIAARRGRGDRRPVDGRLRRDELRRAPPGHVRRGGVVLGRARGRVGRRVGASAAPTRRAGARTCRSRSPRGCGRSRSSSCARATEGRARSIVAARSPTARACALERYLHRGNVRLHERLRALGIRHTWDDYGAGTHDWPYWRRDLRETLPDLQRVLARA